MDIDQTYAHIKAFTMADAEYLSKALEVDHFMVWRTPHGIRRHDLSDY